MRILKIAVLALLALAFSACSLDKQRIDYKVVSARAPALEVPPDLTAPAANEKYAVPDGEGALAANFSDYLKGTVAHPAAVLPESKSVRLERSDNKRWLVVSDKAENVWFAVKTFWLEMGFSIQVDNPQAGVMETDWRENRGNSPKYFERGALGNGKVLDTLKPAGQREQYVIRLARSNDGLSTEVHITQQAMQEVQILNKKEPRWLPQAPDAEIESAVLQMLMAKLGGVASPPVASAAPTASAASVDIELKEIAGGKAMQIKESFDKSWRRVGLALDKAHIAVEDVDRSSGVYLLRAADVKGKKQGNYQVTVHESGGVSEVSVRNAAGENDQESLRIVEMLFKSIEK